MIIILGSAGHLPIIHTAVRCECSDRRQSLDSFKDMPLDVAGTGAGAGAGTETETETVATLKHCSSILELNGILLTHVAAFAALPLLMPMPMLLLIECREMWHSPQNMAIMLAPPTRLPTP
ncbi:hypothetical protein ACLKA7_016286 [Drosophila subpalustris]